MKPEKPAPVDHTSYAKTLAMAEQNLAAAESRVDELKAELTELDKQCEAKSHACDLAIADVHRIRTLVEALKACLAPGAVAKPGMERLATDHD